MATTRQPANIQAYLDKHKVSSIFEEITSLLVKELPDNPLDFIILKLQAKKKKGVSSSTRPAATSTVPGPKKRLDVTGTAISSSKPAQPSKPKTAGASTTTSRPASGSKPTTTTTRPKPATVPSSSNKVGSSTGLTSKKPTGVASKSTGIPNKSTGIPSKSTGTSGPIKPTTPRSKTGTAPSGLKKPGTPAASKTPPTKPKAATPARKPAAEKKQQVKPTEKVTREGVTKEAVTKVDVTKEPEDDDEVGSPLGGDVSDSAATTDDEGDPQMDVLELLRKRQRCKHSIKQNQEKEHLKLLLYSKDSSPVSCYHSDSDDEEEEELEVVESIDALEEEGVVLTGEARRMSMKLPTPSPSVSLKVHVCARCAKVLSSEDTSKLTSIDEFESASQINSQASFPQWDMESAEQGELSAKQKWAMGCVPGTSELTSEVTVTTDATQKGSSPQTYPLVTPSDEESDIPEPVDYQKTEDSTVDSELTDSGEVADEGPSPQTHTPSDEESELKIPTPVDYHKPEDTTGGSESHSDEESELKVTEPVDDQKADEDEDSMVDSATSEVVDDTQKELFPQTHPLVAPSDEESELKIPEPVDYHKPDDEDSVVVAED